MKLKSLILPIIICIGISATFCLITCKGNKIEVIAESLESTIKTDNPHLRVFIENSGSMDGYMCDGSQLKDAVYDYVSELNRYTTQTDLYYINSDTIPYKGSITSYIKSLNPSVFKQAGGNTSNTDLGDILTRVLSTVNDSTVVIFVSDCILDLPNKNAQKFLTNCEIQIKNAVVNTLKKVPSLGLEILKLNSDFSGKYFQPNGAVVHLSDVKRPYYIWIAGDKNYLAKLNSEVSISIFDRYDLDGSVAFSTISDIPLDITNKNLTSKVVAPSGNGFEVTIRADFRTTLQPDERIQDQLNYSFNNKNLIVNEVKRIKTISSPYTHYINFTIPKGVPIVQDILTFKAPELPSWIEESNDDSGTNITANLSKTTGIKYLIQGVADAYKNEKVYASMKFNVKAM